MSASSIAEIKLPIMRPDAAMPFDKAHAEIVAGLSAPHPFISPKYFYDALGSKLFEAICELPEYYPTRTEAAIFQSCAPEMAAEIGHGATFIDLGAGNCAKAARLFPFLNPRQYVPIDISASHLHDAVTHLRQRHPGIEMLELAMDFSSGLALPAKVRREKRLFFYPGSSIGNFTPPEALAFLRGLRRACGEDGGILIGVDLLKDKAVLEAAYDDGLGVTASFNLNALLHLNRVLGADFKPGDWHHLSCFNDEQSRIEMYLEARREVLVTWPGGVRRFLRGERIHTENSYKYTIEAFQALLVQAGFGASRAWTDAAGWFAVIHARALN